MKNKNIDNKLIMFSLKYLSVNKSIRLQNKTIRMKKYLKITDIYAIYSSALTSEKFRQSSLFETKFIINLKNLRLRLVSRRESTVHK